MSDIRTGIDPRRQASFTMGNRLRRCCWGLAWFILGRPSPRPFHAWRSLLLRLGGARMGKGCHVYPGVRIWAPWKLIMDDQASLADGVTCYNIAEIHLGRRAVVSQGAHLCTGTHDHEDPGFQLLSAPITIGAEAWVCAEAFLAPGVTVGEGAVIGARALLLKDAEPWTVYGGHPARAIKPRRMRTP